MQIPSFKNWWQVFAGDSTEKKDLIFRMKRSTCVLQSNEEWLVYLAANTTKEKFNFKMIGNRRKMNYTIYSADSNFVVAQITKEHKLNFPLEKHAFGATISPNCDYSFVAALIGMFHFVYGTDDAGMMLLFGTAALVATINS